jgi:hypothetical protein
LMPNKLPGLRWLTGLTAVYAFIWMSLEGNLTRVIVMGTAVSLTVAAHLLPRLLGGRVFQPLGWLAVMGLVGLLVGVGSGMLTFVFMALKTGLHGHGPEFSAAEIESVLASIPLWGLAGLVAGLGVSLLVIGRGKQQ